MNMLNLARIHLFTALATVITFAFASCDNAIYDDEGDCEVVHKIRFVYDLNLKWADAFPSEVNSVNLYVFDADGVFVKEYLGRGEALSQPDYHMVLDLPAGDYKFVAWCGLENEGATEESFTVPQPIPGVTTINELTCRLNTQASQGTRSGGDAEIEYSDKQLHFLYHGYMDISLIDNRDGKEYTHTMYLTKNTNHVRVILQELSGEGMDKEDYDFTIEDANGFMEYNNELRNSNVITYKPWWQDSDELGVGKNEPDGAIQYVRGVYADLTVGRMMAAHQDDMLLTIKRHNTQEIIAHVPILQYALLSKKYYEAAYGHAMSDQEFLDREDEYVLTFFLVNGKWLDDLIMIHSWRIVRNGYDLGFE